MLFVIGLLITGTCLHAQDSIHITLTHAEKQFLERNLALLAEKCNISLAQAEVIQARLYNNPNLSLQGAVYNPETKQWADVGSQSGQYAIQLQQLIMLAGKRNKHVKLARTEVSMAENQFFDLLRTLGFSLRSNFYKAYYLQNSVRAFKLQVETLEKLNDNYTTLQAKGVISLKDAVRVRSLLYSLKAEQTAIQNDLNDVEAELQLLLRNNLAVFIPEPDTKNIPAIKDLSLQMLLDTAYANRQDLQLARNTHRYSEQNYALQKALAVPDLTVGAAFDKRGSYVTNSSLLNVAMDLPFFNRNQGHIKAAKLSIEQNKLLLEQQTATVENEVRTAYIKAVTTDNLNRSVDPAFRGQFESLLNSVMEHLLKKEISLLEFTDFYDSYKQNILQLNDVQNNRMQAVETLNYAIGKNLLNN